MKLLSIRDVDKNDIKEWEEAGLNAEALLSKERKYFEFEDEHGHRGGTFIEKSIIDKVGLDYIKGHVTLEYSKISERYDAWLSLNDYYNDPKRNPPMTIEVKYKGKTMAEGYEIYRAVTGNKVYLRQVSRRENFVRWTHNDNYIRANVTFVHNDEKETVTYDDWNDCAAYSNTFNPYFRTGKS